jgi:T5SS/PEP-CTERM-associated repeat protein
VKIINVFLMCFVCLGSSVTAIAGVYETGDVQHFGDSVIVGINGEAEWSVDDSTEVTIDSLSIGSGVSAIGTARVRDPGTLVNLKGAQNRLGVGESGIGRLEISGGATIDGTVNPNSCDGSMCNFFVGNAAGSTGDLIVTGTGSTLKTMTSFVLGGAAVFTQANDGFDFGIPGAEVHASMEISDNAHVESVGVNISGGPGGGSPTGDEQSFGTVTVTGSSDWTMDQLNMSSGPNAHAELTISDGSTVTINNFLFVGYDQSSQPVINVDNGSLLDVDTSIISPHPGSKTKLRIDAAAFTNRVSILPDFGELDLVIEGGGEMSATDFLIISRNEGSSAHIRLGKGAVMEAGIVVALGYNFAGVNPGSCHVVMTRGSIIRSENVVIGPNCRVVGTGIIEGNYFNLGGLVGKGITIIQP